MWEGTLLKSHFFQIANKFRRDYIRDRIIYTGINESTDEIVVDLMCGLVLGKAKR